MTDEFDKIAPESIPGRADEFWGNVDDDYDEHPADKLEREFTEKCKALHLELLKAKEQIVPPCVMYERQ